MTAQGHTFYPETDRQARRSILFEMPDAMLRYYESTEGPGRRKPEHHSYLGSHEAQQGASEVISQKESAGVLKPWQRKAGHTAYRPESCLP